MIPRRVLFAMAWVPSYHEPFYALLRERLATVDVEVSVVHGLPPTELESRKHTTLLPWGLVRRNRFVRLGGRLLVWQPARRLALDADLVVVDEGIRQLLNWWLLVEQVRDKARVAFWGHGGNLNADRAIPLAETLKRRAFRLPHWWFAYTAGGSDRLQQIGYPADRITVTCNAAADDSLRREIAAARRACTGDKATVGLFLGSLYADKRLDFLLDVADRVVREEPEFRLVVAGDGPERGRLAAAAAARPHVQVAGRLDGPGKAAVLASASMLLMPGAVGLAVVDGFAASLPIITTSVSTHGPEFEYVRDGVNGRVLRPQATADEYASAVVSLIRNDAVRAKLSEGAAQAAGALTVEEMARRFAEGVERALAASPRRLAV